MSKQTPKSLFQEGDDSATILRAWWESLEREKGERAFLRRASYPAEVVFSPAYHRLLSQLWQHDCKVKREPLAVIAGLATHVKEDTGSVRNIAQQMASPKPGGNGARLSGLRFRRLLAVNQWEELYPLMIRVIRLLGGRVNLISLANAVYWWNERTRKEWAYDYYSTAPGEK